MNSSPPEKSSIAGCCPTWIITAVPAACFCARIINARCRLPGERQGCTPGGSSHFIACCIRSIWTIRDALPWTRTGLYWLNLAAACARLRKQPPCWRPSSQSCVTCSAMNAISSYAAGRYVLAALAVVSNCCSEYHCLFIDTPEIFFLTGSAAPFGRINFKLQRATRTAMPQPDSSCMLLLPGTTQTVYLLLQSELLQITGEKAILSAR